jgi:hypothetical protein
MHRSPEGRCRDTEDKESKNKSRRDAIKTQPDRKECMATDMPCIAIGSTVPRTVLKEFSRNWVDFNRTIGFDHANDSPDPQDEQKGPAYHRLVRRTRKQDPSAALRHSNYASVHDSVHFRQDTSVVAIHRVSSASMGSSAVNAEPVSFDICQNGVRWSFQIHTCSFHGYFFANRSRLFSAAIK